MTFTQLEIFARVAELRGFTLAATRLGISQSAVSHALKALEQEMGVELIHRHQAGVELTDIGAQLLQTVPAVLGDPHHPLLVDRVAPRRAVPQHRCQPLQLKQAAVRTHRERRMAQE